jgi:hypothetical protein
MIILIGIVALLWVIIAAVAICPLRCHNRDRNGQCE